MDSFGEALEFARRRTSCNLVVGDANDPPFGAEFDVVGLFDVLEHLPDDRHVLHQMSGLLRPGGALLLTVPADPSLWSYFDVASHHVRRYELDDLLGKLAAAGFRVEYATYFMQALVPVLRLYRRLMPMLSRSRDIDVERDLTIIPVVNTVMYQILRRELTAIDDRRVRKSGTSILVIARWPGVAA